MTDKPEVISYWYAFDSNADKPYIKKEKGSGLLASFDCAEDAQRFCQWRQDVKYKEVQYVRLTDHERLQAEAERLQAARAADKARIAELEKERDEWHRLFDSAGQLSKNACDDLNSAKSRIAELVLSLRTVVGMLHHRATTPLERQTIRIAETALAQQGKEGEC